jgi:hypothetical protein
VKLGLENKKKTIWAAVLGAVALLLFAYEFIPMFTGSPSEPATSAEAAGPAAIRVTAHKGGKAGKKVKTESLDPTLRLDLLAASEQTMYEGSGRNIFVSQPDAPKIPTPVASGRTDGGTGPLESYRVPSTPPPPPIPLKFFGFASQPGEPKKIFLETASGEDVWIAAEGEIVDRRYKVIRISNTSVEIQDVVNSGPPQSIPLTQG